MNRTNNTIEDLLHASYKINGRGPDFYDCYGLGIDACRILGHTLPDLEEARKDGYNFMECLEKGVELAKLKEVVTPNKEADIIFFKNNAGIMDHMGVYLGNGMYIHCNVYGVHIEKLSRRTYHIGRVYQWL